ncbi:MAG: carboxypeptidase M32 [Albidovulum sp.]|nr:carboxypeptidase M32 [Albidovulum sp.]MDE0533422.1 carboxypeptidase M32 [Albidovulum sp.]
MNAFENLMAHMRTSEALGDAIGHLYWDRDTQMPENAGGQRAEVLASMHGILHERRTDPRIGEWLAAIGESGMSPENRANIRIIRNDFERFLKLPQDLPRKLAKETSLAQAVWKHAKESNSTEEYLPALEKVVDLKRDEAEALADGGDAYDALLDKYESGTSASMIEPIFARLRKGLVELLGAVGDRDLRAPAPKANFPTETQLEFARELARAFSYDFERGRLDVTAHPFSAGSGDDARITTRTDEKDPFNCIYSTIHETGHAVYERNIDRKFLFQPVGRAASFGVHESQSRLFENQLGRGRAFCGWMYRRMRDAYGEFGVSSENEFYASVNRVDAGYIRTDADEIHYNLHVLMRFDLEREIIRGHLRTSDIEEAWNARFEADFGHKVDKPSNGFLQDVHWSVGEFGYFPTYTLGNIYAGCLFAALTKDLPDLNDSLGRGSAEPATDWLQSAVHRFGALRLPRETIETACGFEVSEKPLLRYLEEKFSSI